MAEGIEGGCRCGAVRYAIDLAELPLTYACHCHFRQTWSGSAFSQQAMLQKTQAPPPPSQPIRIALSDDGLTSWNGVGITRAELEEKLDAVAGNQPEVMIQATRLVRYSNVIAVLASVQRHGITRVGVVQGA